jgi:hypothetical protein
MPNRIHTSTLSSATWDACLSGWCGCAVAGVMGWTTYNVAEHNYELCTINHEMISSSLPFGGLRINDLRADEVLHQARYSPARGLLRALLRAYSL